MQQPVTRNKEYEGKTRVFGKTWDLKLPRDLV